MRKSKKSKASAYTYKIGERTVRLSLNDVHHQEITRLGDFLLHRGFTQGSNPIDCAISYLGQLSTELEVARAELRRSNTKVEYRPEPKQMSTGWAIKSDGTRVGTEVTLDERRLPNVTDVSFHMANDAPHGDLRLVIKLPGHPRLPDLAEPGKP